MAALGMGWDAEVIVVGGGPAGSATAFFLARAGLDVLLLDRARFPRDKPCAEYLSPQASRILNELGLLATLEGGTVPAAQLTGMTIVPPSGEAFSGSFVGEHGFRGFRDRGLAVRRHILDALLLDRARTIGVRVVENERVGDLLPDAGRTVGVSTVGAAARAWRAPLVIGADGLRSVVAKRAGLSRRLPWPRRMALVAHYAHVAGMGAHGEMHVYPDGYAGLASVGGGVTNVAVVVPMRAITNAAGRTDSFLADWFERHPLLAARLASATRLSPVSITGPFASSCRRAWGPGVALVGDAADFFDPFTGEGIYAALRGAELLTPYAIEAARATTAAQQSVALAAYERCRRAEFAGKWRVERLVGAAVSTPTLMNVLARSLGNRRDLADLLIGVAGDFVPAQRVLRPQFIWQLARAALGQRTPPTIAAGPQPSTTIAP